MCGSGFRERTLAVKSRKNARQFFLSFIFLLVCQNIWGNKISALGVCLKWVKSGRNRKRKTEDRERKSMITVVSTCRLNQFLLNCLSVHFSLSLSSLFKSLFWLKLSLLFTKQTRMLNLWLKWNFYCLYFTGQETNGGWKINRIYLLFNVYFNFSVGLSVEKLLEAKRCAVAIMSFWRYFV